MNKPSNVVRCTPEHLRYLADNARQDEREQFAAFIGRDYDVEEAVQFCAAMPLAFTVMAGDVPAAAGGYCWTSPGTWQSWMIGTAEGWRTHWRSITRAAKWMMAAMFECGARRLETYVLAGRHGACEWYERCLGLTLESVKQGIASGHDVGLFVRTA